MYKRFPRRATKPLRAISVARTVEAPQSEFEEFLNVIGKDLGQRASIRTVTSTRLTLLESGGIKKAMRKAHTDPQSVNKFSFWLSHQLDSYRATPIEVTVNKDEPIALMGRNRDKLALRIVEDEQVKAERAKTEELLVEEFDTLPPLKPFEPHITVGYVGIRALTTMEVRHPELLVNNDIIPTTVALNGLTVFLEGKGLKH